MINYFGYLFWLTCSVVIFCVLHAGKAFPEVYKCKINGTIYFSDKPCSEDGKNQEIYSGYLPHGNQDDLFLKNFKKVYDEFKKTTSIFLMPFKDIVVYQKHDSTMWASPMLSLSKTENPSYTMVFSLEADTWYFVENSPISVMIDGEIFETTKPHIHRSVGGVWSKYGVLETVVCDMPPNILKAMTESNEVKIRIHTEKLTITSTIKSETLRAWARLVAEFEKEVERG